MKEKKNKKLLLITYIFSIFFMLIGITFSYFTSKAISNNNSLNIKSGKLELELAVSPKYTGHPLIPLSNTNIMTAYENKCVDYYGSGVCVAYDIFITNNSAEQEVIGTISFNINHIDNLSYLLLDENETIYQDMINIGNNELDMPLGEKFRLESALQKKEPITKKFILLIWVSDKDYEQTGDISGTFEASITYNSIYGHKLTSTIIEEERK